MRAGRQSQNPATLKRVKTMTLKRKQRLGKIRLKLRMTAMKQMRRKMILKILGLEEETE